MGIARLARGDRSAERPTRQFEEDALSRRDQAAADFLFFTDLSNGNLAQAAKALIELEGFQRVGAMAAYEAAVA